MGHLSSFPGSQRPNREWLFLLFDQGAPLSWILGTTMMATQPSVADHHHGYIYIYVYIADSSCQGVLIKEAILIFWYAFLGSKSHKPRSWLQWLHGCLRWSSDQDDTILLYHSADLSIEIPSLGNATNKVDSASQVVVEAKSTTLGVSVWYRQIQAKVVWSWLLHWIQSTSMDFGMRDTVDVWNTAQPHLESRISNHQQ